MDTALKLIDILNNLNDETVKALFTLDMKPSILECIPEKFYTPENIHILCTSKYFNLNKLKHMPLCKSDLHIVLKHNKHDYGIFKYVMRQLTITETRHMADDHEDVYVDVIKLPSDTLKFILYLYDNDWNRNAVYYILRKYEYHHDILFDYFVNQYKLYKYNHQILHDNYTCLFYSYIMEYENTRFLDKIIKSLHKYKKITCGDCKKYLIQHYKEHPYKLSLNELNKLNIFPKKYINYLLPVFIFLKRKLNKNVTCIILKFIVN
jgi:hypothetical protein